MHEEEGWKGGRKKKEEMWERGEGRKKERFILYLTDLNRLSLEMKSQGLFPKILKYEFY